MKTVTISEKEYEELLAIKNKEEEISKLVEEFRRYYEMSEPIRRESNPIIEDNGLSEEEYFIKLRLKELGYTDWKTLFELNGISRI